MARLLWFAARAKNTSQSDGIFGNSFHVTGKAVRRPTDFRNWTMGIDEKKTDVTALDLVFSPWSDLVRERVGILNGKRDVCMYVQYMYIRRCDGTNRAGTGAISGIGGNYEERQKKKKIMARQAIWRVIDRFSRMCVWIMVSLPKVNN